MSQIIDARRIETQLRSLAALSETVAGVTRLPFSKAATGTIAYLSDRMTEVGLSVHVDATGAVHGLREVPGRKRIVIGSHYDSVPEGGGFDGIAGVVCGLEIARLLQHRKLHYGLEIVAFNDEEGVRFGDGFLSSKALLGELDMMDLKERYDGEGLSIFEAARRAGLHPEQLAEDRWKLEELEAFFEIHVEQGSVLETANKKLGLVKGIVGMRRYRISLEGQADHAGTTPMALRHDALLPAAAVIRAAHEAAVAYPGAVATVGSLQVYPCAVNTVPGRVVLSLDLRSLQPSELEGMEKKILQSLEQEAGRAGVSFEIKQTLSSQPGYMDEALLARLQAEVGQEEIPAMVMTSGAGHDALPISAKVPTAMLFVPSRGGRSHCPEEWSDCGDLARASEVLLNTIIRMNMEE